MKCATLILTAICCAPVLVCAADSASTQGASETPVHNPRDVDLRALLREVGAREHKHIVCDPRVSQLIDLGNLDHQDLTYPQLLAVLQMYGFAVIADANILEVVPDANIRFAATPLVPPDNIKGPDDEWVTTIVPLKGLTATQLVTILRPLVPTNGQVNALMERNAVIIVERSANVRRLVEMIRTLEKMSPAAANAPERTLGQ
jgi:general secretion pathway protein D